MRVARAITGASGGTVAQLIDVEGHEFVVLPFERGTLEGSPTSDLDVDGFVRKAVVPAERAEPRVHSTLERILDLVAQRRGDGRVRIPPHAEVQRSLSPHDVVERPVVVVLDRSGRASCARSAF